MSKFFKITSNLLICLLIFIIIFLTLKRFNGYYDIKYTDFSKSEINNFISEYNIKLKDNKCITNVTMQRVIPSGYAYTIHYIDSNDKKQHEKISRKSETAFKDFMMEYGENLDKKYNSICKITFYILVSIIILKGIIIHIQNKRLEQTY